MNPWDLATHAAVWILIGGSSAVFGWFLVEVIRMARSGGRRTDAGPPGRRDSSGGADEVQ